MRSNAAGGVPAYSASITPLDAFGATISEPTLTTEAVAVFGSHGDNNARCTE